MAYVVAYIGCVYMVVANDCLNEIIVIELVILLIGFRCSYLLLGALSLSKIYAHMLDTKLITPEAYFKTNKEQEIVVGILNPLRHHILLNLSQLRPFPHHKLSILSKIRPLQHLNNIEGKW